MSRINTESARVTDYYPAVAAPEVEGLVPADQDPKKSEGNRLYRQMQAGMQDFNAFINESNATIRQERLGKSIAGAETVKQGLSQCPSQPTADMNTLMLEMNKLLSKMRDLQRDHAIQQQQQALKMQDKAYNAEKDSIAKSQSAATTSAIFGGLGAGIGLVAGGLKTKGSLGKMSAEAKKGQVNKLMVDKGFKSKFESELEVTNPDKNSLEGAAFSKVNENASSSKWSKLNPGNWGKSSTSIEQLDKKIASNTRWEGLGDLSTGLAPMGDVIGKAASMGDTAASQQLKVGADRGKGLQYLNEREQGIRDDQARDASKQMRDVQSQMNDLYGKIASAVRW